MATARQCDALDGWGIVCGLLPERWEQDARKPGTLKRARGIADAATLLRVLLVHLAEGCSLQGTVVRARQAGWCSISAVALFKRLQAAGPWLRWKAEQLWQARRGPLAADGYRLRAVNATTIQEPGSRGTSWRLHYALDLRPLLCDHLELTGAHGGETFRRIDVAPGDLMLGDRVYGTSRGIAHVVAHGGDVLVRIAPHMLPLFSKTGQKRMLLRRVAGLPVGTIGRPRPGFTAAAGPSPAVGSRSAAAGTRPSGRMSGCVGQPAARDTGSDAKPWPRPRTCCSGPACRLRRWTPRRRCRCIGRGGRLSWRSSGSSRSWGWAICRRHRRTAPGRGSMAGCWSPCWLSG